MVEFSLPVIYKGDRTVCVCVCLHFKNECQLVFMKGIYECKLYLTNMGNEWSSATTVWTRHGAWTQCKWLRVPQLKATMGPGFIENWNRKTVLHTHVDTHHHTVCVCDGVMMTDYCTELCISKSDIDQMEQQHLPWLIYWSSLLFADMVGTTMQTHTLTLIDITFIVIQSNLILT